MFFPFSDLEEELLEEDWLSGKKVKQKIFFYILLHFINNTICSPGFVFCLEAGKYVLIFK